MCIRAVEGRMRKDCCSFLPNTEPQSKEKKRARWRRIEKKGAFYRTETDWNTIIIGTQKAFATGDVPWVGCACSNGSWKKWLA